jgi:5-(carboxyamino)imidazole ribonucleotide synthase
MSADGGINVQSGVYLKVGILGGGQLARMLAMDGFRLGLDVHVFAANINESGAQVCPHSQIGKVDDVGNVTSFLLDLPFATIESEFLDTKVLEASIGSTKLHPVPKILEILQDRLTQKELLEKHNIATAPFQAWNKEVPAENLFKKFDDGFVLKKRRFGYDGYGTFVFRKTEPAPQVRHDPVGYIAEELIPFKRELAFSIARNENGDFAVFPLVETKQEDSRCVWVKGPVKHQEFDSIVTKFKQLLKKIEYCGILAVELFDHKGELLVNELAPRVHNSAHYSINALSMSQFEAHWRAVLNWPLKDPEPLERGFAMVNLLGEDPRALIDLSSEAKGWLHWYGKQENRPGRKMGHLNTVGATADDALATALKWRKDFKL